MPCGTWTDEFLPSANEVGPDRIARTTSNATLGRSRAAHRALATLSIPTRSMEPP